MSFFSNEHSLRLHVKYSTIVTPNFIVVCRHYIDLNCELNSFFFNFQLLPFLTYCKFITFTFNPNNRLLLGILLLVSRQLSAVASCFNLSFAFWLYIRVLIMKYITCSVSTILSWPKRWKTICHPITSNWELMFTFVVCFVTSYTEKLPLATHQHFIGPLQNIV